MTTDEAIPAYFFDKITDIRADDLREMGVEAVCIDLDNTTVYDASFHSIEGVKDWIKNIRAEGFRVLILTNTFKLRAKILARKFGKLEYIASAKKPSPKAFMKAQKMTDLPAKKIAMIGDQLFTDVQGANSVGMVSVKVRYAKPEVLLGNHWKKIRRRERRYLKERGISNERKNRKTSQ